MRLALLAVLALLVAFPAYADTAQNLQVTMVVPFYGTPFENVNISFNWNTGTDAISNAIANYGFTFGGAVFDPQSNDITSTYWSGPLGGFEQDPEYEIGTNLEILPQPGTYPVVIYEYCPFNVGQACNAPGGPTTGALATVTDPPVSTPEPSLLVLLLYGGAITLLAAFAFRYLITAVG